MARLVFFFLLKSIGFRIRNVQEWESRRSRERKGWRAGTGTGREKESDRNIRNDKPLRNPRLGSPRELLRCSRGLVRAS